MTGFKNVCDQDLIEEVIRRGYDVLPALSIAKVCAERVTGYNEFMTDPKDVSEYEGNIRDSLLGMLGGAFRKGAADIVTLGKHEDVETPGYVWSASASVLINQDKLSITRTSLPRGDHFIQVCPKDQSYVIAAARNSFNSSMKRSRLLLGLDSPAFASDDLKAG